MACNTAMDHVSFFRVCRVTHCKSGLAAKLRAMNRRWGLDAPMNHRLLSLCHRTTILAFAVSFPLLRMTQVVDTCTIASCHAPSLFALYHLPPTWLRPMLAPP